MGTVADKLTYLEGTKTAIKDAIVAKGVAVSDTDTFRNYATKIGEISSGEPIDKKKYGASIDNVLGNVDENGAYRFPTEPFTLDLSSVKSLPAFGFAYKFYNTGVSGDLVISLEGDLSSGYAMYYAFSSCYSLTSVSFPALATISIVRAMGFAFYGCTSLTSVSFPALTTISGSSAIESAFTVCSSLTSVSFPQLTTISGSRAMGFAFQDCSSLTSVSFPQLATISGSSAMQSAFRSCSSLTSVSFPQLKEILPETTQNQFNNMFSGCEALTEIHFPAAMQARVEQLTGYADKWGATNATIYFDL